MPSKTDDQMTALAAAGYGVGSLADRQRAYLIGNRGYAGPVASIADMVRSVGMSNGLFPLLDLGSGGGGSWTPASLGAALKGWYDPSDAGTLTMAGAKVSQINDKSGNGAHLIQPTDGNRPTLDAINSLVALNFGAGGNLQSSTRNAIPLGTSQTILMVSTPNTSGGGGYVLTLSNGVSNHVHLAIISGFDSKTFEVFSAATLFAGLRFDLALGAVNQHIIGIKRGGTSLEGRFNGAAVGASVRAENPSLFFAGISGFLNDGSAVSDTIIGKIGEIIVTNTDMSPADLISVEAYLKAKWNTP